LSWASTWGTLPSDIFVSYFRSISSVSGWAAAIEARISIEKSPGIRTLLFVVYLPFSCLGDGLESGIRSGAFIMITEMRSREF
jgi:hypothetical protein